MRYSLHFPSDPDLPREVRTRAGKVLRDVAASLQRFPANPAWWNAMRTGFAEVNVGGWRFEYRIDPRKNTIQVVTARQLSPESV
ncbi:MAG TPA: hypothetical protein VEP66_03575 [Myxococcales bacterium]|nr:hypothetical protein [Myxococcales bacterium]